MKLLLLLSGENLDLAREEVLALAGTKKCRQLGKAMFIEAKPFDFARLAFTRKVYKFIFSCKEEKIFGCMQKTRWNLFYKKNFCVRTIGSKRWKEKDLASMIWHHLKKPKVNLSSPSTQFDFIFSNGKVSCGSLIAETGKGFMERRTHLRPGSHPSSMSAKLARAIVNLTGVKPKETLLDPFCGCGGILIEAGMVGAKAIGIDIDPLMVGKTKKNMDFYGIKDYRLVVADSTTVKIPKVDVIATDPPYGISSSLHKREMKELYPAFLENACNLLKKGKRMCIVFPSSIRIKSEFKRMKQIDFYVHKSLTRRILILEKRA